MEAGAPGPRGAYGKRVGGRRGPPAEGRGGSGRERRARWAPPAQARGTGALFGSPRGEGWERLGEGLVRAREEKGRRLTGSLGRGGSGVELERAAEAGSPVLPGSGRGGRGTPERGSSPWKRS